MTDTTQTAGLSQDHYGEGMRLYQETFTREGNTARPFHFLTDAQKAYWIAHAALAAQAAPCQSAKRAANQGSTVAWREDWPTAEIEIRTENEKARADVKRYGFGFSVNGWHVPAHLVLTWGLTGDRSRKDD